MKIAFITYEYPPDAAYGGIATYVHQAARMLYGRGHHVEVFTSSPYRSGTEIEDGLVVHRIVNYDFGSFAVDIGQVFAERHATVKFDVLEGPEFSADAREAVRLVPEIPLVVKLHTPRFLVAQGTYDGLPMLTPMRLRMLAAKVLYHAYMLRRGSKPSWHYVLNYDVEAERLHTLEADEIVAPSRAIGKILIDTWCLDKAKVSFIPNAYIPTHSLLNIPADTHTNTVTFLGRLEIQKGVLDLARAIPLVLRRFPKANFRFVGPAENSPKPNANMQKYLEHRLQHYGKSVEFTGPVAFDKIPEVLSMTDICVFPSIWDNFPNVCLESMAAARGIVGSSAGGMADMLDFGQVGRIIPPRSPRKIAKAVIELLEDPELRMKLGKAARDRLLGEYNAERIGPLQEASYIRAIVRKRAKLARSSSLSNERVYG